jgi:hypothetical protein
VDVYYVAALVPLSSATKATHFIVSLGSRWKFVSNSDQFFKTHFAGKFALVVDKKERLGN